MKTHTKSYIYIAFATKVNPWIHVYVNVVFTHNDLSPLNNVTIFCLANSFLKHHNYSPATWFMFINTLSPNVFFT